jgi:PD-(D/E)XK endonuclease
MQALRVMGYSVLVPFGENTRYDLVIDDGENLGRVQCKTGRLRDGAIRFATCSCYAHHANPRRTRRNYHGQVDFFAVHCPETTGVYLIPLSELETNVQGTLRVSPARNSQRRGVRVAAGYEIAKVSVSVTRALRASSGAR